MISISSDTIMTNEAWDKGVGSGKWEVWKWEVGRRGDPELSKPPLHTPQGRHDWLH